jgi:3-mercaptopyruvate sulfurtransferase SseA
LRALVAMLLILSGCTVTPTKTVETTHRDLVQVVEKAQKPLVITEATVVLDVRSRFDYGLNHVQNSINFLWENLAENAQTGEPLRDSRQAAMRLSLLGLRPETPVVILGYGIHGNGEEGRLAWSLLSLGFQDVQVSAIEAFRQTMTPNETPPSLNEKAWDVNPRAELQIGKNEVLNLLDKHDTHVLVVNVGKKGVGTKTLDWKNFYTAQGRPNPGVEKLLGADKSDRIILVGERGIPSGAATYALLALGYAHVQNYVSH